MDNEYECLKIFECGNCKKLFAVGIDLNYSLAYKKKALNYDEAFREYLKEMRNFGATIEHFKTIPEKCPHCSSKNFKKKERYNER